MTSNHRHGTTGKYAVAGDIDKLVAGKAPLVHAHPDIVARLDAIEEDAAVTKALLLAAIGDGSFHPPVDPPAGPASFIAPTGSDTTGDGSIGNPWATIQKFIDSSPAAGTTLYCRGGTYTNPPDSECGYGGHPSLVGTALAPITIRNYPNEVPVFTGGSGTFLGIRGQTSPSAWVVVDGLTVQNRTLGAAGMFGIGQWPAANTTFNVEHVTFRNIQATMKYGDVVNQSHLFYIGHASRYTTVEDGVFIGAGPGGGGGGSTDPGSWTYSPTPTGTIIRRCVIKDFTQGGLIIWDNTANAYTMDVLVSHCSFINNTNLGAMRIEAHGPTTIIDCASTGAYVAPGSGSGAPWIYHGYSAITDVTQTNNYFNQTFDSNYRLVAGQTGRGAGTDGTDAGALDW